MYQDMKQQILSSTSKVIVDQKSGGGNLLYLPLDKLIQSTNPGTETPAAKPTEQLNSAPGDATPTPSPRVRESLFGRDRESR
jgi:membrane protease subunit HflK